MKMGTKFNLVIKEKKLFFEKGSGQSDDIENHHRFSIDQQKAILLEIAQSFFFFEGKVLDRRLPSKYIKGFDLEKKEVLFFPGTFNPFHEGHLECLKQCAQENIIIIPDFNPWKKNEKRAKSPLAKYLSLVSQFEKTPHVVFPGFLAKAAPNPTVDWLPRTFVKKRNILMGDDTFIELEKWKGSEKLISYLSEIHVLFRDIEHEKTLMMKEKLRQRHDGLVIKLYRENFFRDLSSSKIRSLKR